MVHRFIGIAVAFVANTVVSGYTPVVPPVSPATSLPNQVYDWKEKQQIRYQVDGPEDGEPVLLVHGLFVNADHWRQTIKAAAAEGYRTYAIDLWGCGYSSKPPYNSKEAQAVNGENRFTSPSDNILKNIELGTASGKNTRIADVDLRHPAGSPYNFYTWSELITDFCENVVLKDHDTKQQCRQQVTLVSNSIGTISSLQAVLDKPDMFRGVFVVSPNFRELHSAEVPFSNLAMPVIRTVQKWLRTEGQPLFDTLAKPGIVKQILKEPYVVQEAVDDVLVKVLLDPLLTEGASDVVFDTLSYSAGPLPEQQLSQFPANKPVWVCYGEDDPWTPAGRVQALQKLPAVKTVVGWDGVGHCPHDEAPELVHPLLFQYLNHVCREKESS